MNDIDGRLLRVLSATFISLSANSAYQVLIREVTLAMSLRLISYMIRTKASTTITKEPIKRGAQMCQE